MNVNSNSFKKLSTKSLDNVINIKKYYGTGKRKNSVAKVWIMKTDTHPNIIINNKSCDFYFVRELHKNIVLKPFSITNTVGEYSLLCSVYGGGLSGQASAISHGISKALSQINSDFHKILRKDNFLTRDSRIVERKKYGKHKARKSTQFSKR